MVTAVGTSTTSAYGAAGQSRASSGSRVGLEAQLATYKKQLSDCINCDSAKTSAGKAQIEALQAKVSTTQARIKQLDNPQAGAATRNGLDNANTASIPRIGDNAAGNVSDVRNVKASAPASSTGAGPGSLVDTFA